jgi:hypothetical protein
MITMHHKSAVCLMALTILAGCSEKPRPANPVPAQVPVAPVAPPAAPTAAEKVAQLLLKAVFGKQYRAGTGDALATLPDPDDRKASGKYVVTAVANTVLKTGETVLVVNAEAANESGEADSGHASPGLLGVYIMRQQDGAWTILKRHENIAALGSSGHFGGVDWVTLAAGKPGLAISSGGTWQGNTIESLSLFDLSAPQLRDLAGGILTYSSNEGACDPDGTQECWTMTGKWHLAPAKTAAAYDDLVFDFAGEVWTRPVNDKDEPSGPRQSRKTTGAARYAFDGHKFVLVEGANPVPEI